jgi:hypothetical protein
MEASVNNTSARAGTCATKITSVPFSVIGKLSKIDKGAVHAHWQRSKEQRSTVLHAGRPLPFLKLKSMILWPLSWKPFTIDTL